MADFRKQRQCCKQCATKLTDATNWKFVTAKVLSSSYNTFRLLLPSPLSLFTCSSSTYHVTPPPTPHPPPPQPLKKKKKPLPKPNQTALSALIIKTPLFCYCLPHYIHTWKVPKSQPALPLTCQEQIFLLQLRKPISVSHLRNWISKKGHLLTVKSVTLCLVVYVSIEKMGCFQSKTANVQSPDQEPSQPDSKPDLGIIFHFLNLSY